MFQYLIVILNSSVVGMDVTCINSYGSEVCISKREN